MTSYMILKKQFENFVFVNMVCNLVRMFTLIYIDEEVESGDD